jgi:hypothetical protein
LMFLSDLTIYKLFSSRADLHRTVYTHAKVKVPIYLELFSGNKCFV